MIHGRRRREEEKYRGKDSLLVPARWMLQPAIQSATLQNALMPIENIPAAWRDPIGDMNSRTSISAFDLIWQMDAYYTISNDRCARQWSAGCCHFEFRNKTSPSKFLLSCSWSSRSAWICMLSRGRTLIKFTGMLAVLKRNLQYLLTCSLCLNLLLAFQWTQRGVDTHDSH